MGTAEADGGDALAGRPELTVGHAGLLGAVPVVDGGLRGWGLGGGGDDGGGAGSFEEVSAVHAGVSGQRIRLDARMCGGEEHLEGSRVVRADWLSHLNLLAVEGWGMWQTLAQPASPKSSAKGGTVSSVHAFPKTSISTLLLGVGY